MTADTHIQLPFTTSHAFIVGINDYQHLSPLSTAVNDAEVLAATLARDHAYQVHPPLLNATRADLMQLLEKDLPQLVGEEDRVLFYFAGHGIALDSDDDPKGYLVPVDAKPGEAETLLAMDDFHAAITKLPCKHGLLILDCCFAGAFKWSTGFRDVMFDLPGIIYEERFHQYAQDPAWQVITSSASDQKAVDILSDRTLGMRSATNAKHSPFAAALLEGLAGEADTIPKEKGDGVITATELYTYLRDRVEDETTEHGKRQSPSMFSLQRHDKGQYVFLHPRHPLNLPPIPDRNPFMGLKSYNETDSGLFYGRDRVITALIAFTEKQPLVVVSGASGTGKSSVIKAGLLPSCRKSGWHILPVVRPGKNPVESLQASLPDLAAVMKAEGESLLIVDQYEELITQCLNPKDRVAFETQLADWVREHPQLHIVISIRSDFEPQFEEGPLAEWWQKGRYVVPVFSQDELREVIIKPTVQEVLFFESDILVDKLLEAVNQAPGALPLLSFTLSELYHAYINSGRTNRAFSLEDYEKLGGVVGALRTRANAIYDDLDQAHQDSMRKLMLRMVSLEGGELASRRVASSDLVFSNSQETARVQRIAQQLVNARLISTGLDTQGQTYYEPAHDALVRAWARLWEWIKAQGEGRLSLMYKLSLAVTDYQEHQANDYLWNDDPRLDLLLIDLQHKGHRFNAQEEAFLEGSKALRQRNQRRRWAIIAAVMIGLASLTIFALYEQRQAKDAQVLAQENEGKALEASALAAKEAENARIQADAALAAKGRAEASDRLAQLRADTALMERNNALWQTTLARRAQTRAEQSAREAKSAATSIKAREMLNVDPTIALNLALAAYNLNPSSESIDVISSVLNNENNRFYKNTFSLGDAEIDCVTFSPDGKSILVGKSNQSMELYDLSGQKLRTFPRQDRAVSAVAFSPDGQTILSGTWNGTITRWNLSAQEQQGFTQHETAIANIAFTADGNNILTASQNGIIKYWNRSGELLQTLDHGGDLNDVAISPDGNYILSGGNENIAKLWNRSGEVVQQLNHQAAINSVCFSPDGRHILTGGEDGTVKLWQIDGEEKQSFDHEKPISSVGFSPDSQTIFSLNKVEEVVQGFDQIDKLETDGITAEYLGERIGSPPKFWRLNGEKIARFLNSYSKATHALFSPDGQTFLTIDEEKTLHLWDRTGRQVETFGKRAESILAHTFSPSGKLLLGMEGNDLIRLWNLQGKALQSFSGEALYPPLTPLSFSPNGQMILGYGKDDYVKLWYVNGEEVESFPQSSIKASHITFSKNGKSLIGVSADNKIGIWNLRGQLIRSFPDAPSNGIDFLWYSDGELLVTTSADESSKSLTLWNTTGQLLKSFPLGNLKYLGAAPLSPDQQCLLTGVKGERKLWNLSTGATVMLPPHEGDFSFIRSAAFAPDGKSLLTGSFDGIIKHTDLAGRTLQTFENLGLEMVFFSSDGQLIVTSGSEHGTKLYRNLYGEYQIGTLWDHVHKLTPEEQAEYGIDWEY